jgi:hypothetical protein
VAGDEPVTSPDQHRPTISKRLARLGLLVTIISLVLMSLFGNHEGRVEEVWMIGIAGLLALWLFIDFVLRKNGLRS